MDTRDVEAATVMAKQHGLLSLDQALAIGFTDDMTVHRVASGRWLHPRRTVFADASSRPSFEQATLAAVLASGPIAAASHLSSTRLWELPAPEPTCIELTTVLERQVRVEGVRAHRTGRFHEHDLTVVRGIPVTSVARTIVDLSSRLTDAQLGKVLDAGMRRGLVSLSRLRACSQRLGRAPGRSPATIERVLSLRIPGYDPGGSDLESEFWLMIVDAGFPAPVREHTVRVGSRTYRLDMAWPDLKIGVEVDGFDAHRTRTAFDADRVRNNELVAVGWRIFHLTSRTTAQHVIAVLSPVFVREPAV